MSANHSRRAWYGHSQTEMIRYLANKGHSLHECGILIGKLVGQTPHPSTLRIQHNKGKNGLEICKLSPTESAELQKICHGSAIAEQKTPAEKIETGLVSRSSKFYNTNLAAEFFVLSVLHRLGIDANLTLGNKKSVDIALVRGKGDAATIDVKGLAGTTGWPVDNVGAGKEGHFIVFVCFLNKIQDPTVMPEAFVVPSLQLHAVIYHAPGGRRVVPVSKMRREGKQYRNAWEQLL